MANKEYTLTPTEGMETTVLLSDEDAERWGVGKKADRSKAATPENKAATPEDKRAAAKVSNKGGG